MSRHFTCLVLCLGGCVAGEVTTSSTSEGQDEGLTADNGLFFDNGLNLPNGTVLRNAIKLPNGLNLANGIDASNGVNLSNAIKLPNGLEGPVVAPPNGSGLEVWIDEDPPMRQRILRYLVECALPAGVSVELVYRGQTSLLGSGIAGLGPSLQNGLMIPGEQEAVSSCLLARVNARGEHISILLQGPEAGLQSANPGDSAYGMIEGTYFGNLFSEVPHAHVCKMNYATCSTLRACKPTATGCDCGVIQPLEQLCFDEESLAGPCGESYGSQLYYAPCAASGRSWTHAITVYLRLFSLGEACDKDYLCESGACFAGVCIAPRAARMACDTYPDCLGGSCGMAAAGICGRPAGSYCSTDAWCLSGSCDLRRRVCR